MANKRGTRIKIRQLKQVKTWQLLVIFLLAAFISATFLRLNNVGMIERRDGVVSADKNGDDVDLESRLYDLQRYVSEHMNADPGRIALDHSYQRAYDKALKKFEQQVASQSGNDVVKKVRQHCDAQAAKGGWGRFRATADPRYVDCINKEWDKYPAAAHTDTQFNSPVTTPYYQTFVSPKWSPDFAGWSLIITGLIAAIIIGRILVIVTLRIILHHKSRSF